MKSQTEYVETIIDHTILALAGVEHILHRERLKTYVQLDTCSATGYRSIHVRVMDERPGDADDDFVVIATIFEDVILRIDLFEGFYQFKVFEVPS